MKNTKTNISVIEAARILNNAYFNQTRAIWEEFKNNILYKDPYKEKTTKININDDAVVLSLYLASIALLCVSSRNIYGDLISGQLLIHLFNTFYKDFKSFEDKKIMYKEIARYQSLFKEWEDRCNKYKSFNNPLEGIAEHIAMVIFKKNISSIYVKNTSKIDPILIGIISDLIGQLTTIWSQFNKDYIIVNEAN